MSTRDEIQELAAGHALGVLDEADRRRFEALRTAGDPELEAALRDFEAASALLAHAAPSAAPSAALRSRVVEAVRQEAGRSPAPRQVIAMPRERRSAGPVWAWGWAAAAAAMAVVSLLGWQSARRLESDLAAARERMAALERTLGSERQWARMLESPVTRRIPLVATPAGAASPAAVALYDPASGRALVTFERVRTPTGGDYELWAIRDGKPASLGLVRADADGRAVLRLEGVGSPESLAAFAVSLEPAGGSPSKDAPSGPVVMMGALAAS